MLELQSPLAAATVCFDWDETEYTPTYHRSNRHLDPRWLEGLGEDLDFPFLVPAEPVAPGDEWDLPLSSLPDLLVPGGCFPWTIAGEKRELPPSDDLDPRTLGELRRLIGEELEGEAMARLLGVEDGIASIELELDVRSEREPTEELGRIVRRGALSEWLEVDQAHLELDFEGRGVARWDLAAGHLAGLELSGELELEVELVLRWLAAGRRTGEIDLRAVISGSIGARVEVAQE